MFFEKYNFSKEIFIENFIKPRSFKWTVDFRKVLFACKFNGLLSLYFLRVSNLTKVRESRSDESGKAARHARRSPISFFLPSAGFQILDHRCRGGIRGIPEAGRTFLYRSRRYAFAGRAKVPLRVMTLQKFFRSVAIGRVKRERC